MKYNININQLAVMNSGLKLDLIDCAIIDFIRNWASAKKATKIDFDGNLYVWIGHKLIQDQLPLLRLKKDSIYRRMKYLCNIGILEQHPQSKQLGMSLYCSTELFDSLLFSEPTDENPMTYGFKSDAPTDENPNYNSNKEDNKNKDTFIGENEFSHHTQEEEVLQFKVPKKETPKKEKVAQKRKSLEDRKNDFRQLLLVEHSKDPEQLPKEERTKFFEYWTEHGPKDKKARFEKEKSFSISRRITTWKNNIKTYKKENHGKQEPTKAYQSQFERIAANLAEKRKNEKSWG